MFSKSKRFQEPVSQAPPVGLYDVKGQTQVSAAAGFGKGKRFTELKDSGLSTATCGKSFLDISSCSTSSRNDSKCSQFATPLPFKKKRNISTSTPDTRGKDHFKNNAAVETEVSELLSEKIELEDKLCQAQQDLQHLENKLQSTLQEKGSHESSIADLHRQLKELRQENDMLLEKLQVITTTNNSIESLKEELTAVKQQLRDKDGVISSLKFELSCAAQSSRADLDLEQDRNRVLNERISHLEKTVSEVTQDRDEVEKANQQLHELVASLRRDNMDFRTKLDEAEEKLEGVCQKLKTAIKENEDKVLPLEEMLSKEMQKSQELGEKLEYSLRQSEENFTKAQSTIVQLQESKENLENKNRDLEAKLFELIEKEQSAEERARHLSVENISIESRLQKCESDYEQRLSIANDQVESLQKELHRYEEMMTENVRSLTDKYQDLEDSYTCFQSEAEKEKNLILAELEVTRQSFQKSRQESDQQLKTCVYLTQKNEQLQEECDGLSQQVNCWKAELEVAKEELTKNMEETGLAKACLRKALDEANNTIDNLIKREEALSQKLQLMESNQKKQEDEIKAFKAQLNSEICEKQEVERKMKDELERYQSINKELEEKLRESEENFTRQIKSFEEKAAKSKEEFGRRLVETQKKLSQAEINFENFRSEQETKSKEKDMEMERKLFSAEEEVNRLKSELSSRTSNDDQLNELKAQIEVWRTKYEDLVQKIEPFKDQLDEYEAERNALLCQNNQAKDEVAKLGQQYAKLLGHQNKKQKIHHVVKLKEENNSLKAVSTLKQHKIQSMAARSYFCIAVEYCSKKAMWCKMQRG
ncbi:hyaluronan mediated motility receptor-like [Pocillopora damicornis]|uniref:hyaluronan mediated motility receptor-like n=1 Tax=Pocillopora damicornis TaxID=46731 RepID=UPI000F553C5E|nr:hyaluronan mediated motility receptor-like [Pocillopora damicornis]